MKWKMKILNGFLLTLQLSLTGCLALSFLNDHSAGKGEVNVESGVLDASSSSEVRTASDLKQLKPMIFEESIQISAPDTTQTL